MSRVTHSETRASQPQVLTDFCTEVLGWTFKPWIPGVGCLVCVNDADGDVPGPTRPEFAAAVPVRRTP